MKDKHTPGPWKHEYLSVVAPNGEPVAASPLSPNGNDLPWDERMANMKLAAAAPDLLREARYTLDMINATIEHRLPQSLHGWERSAATRLEAAIRHAADFDIK